MKEYKESRNEKSARDERTVGLYSEKKTRMSIKEEKRALLCGRW